MLHRSARRIATAVIGALFPLFCAIPCHALTASALQDQTCAGYRSGAMNCTAGEFTIAPVFSASPGTPPFCVAGQSFSFQVDLTLSGTNADRYDVGFFVGQQGNDPTATTPGNICSVATFPTAPLPWEDLNGNACGDFAAGGNQTVTVNKIKVVCQGDSTGSLQIPYVVTYWQNSGGPVCNGPADVTNGSPSKCNKGVSTVNGTVKVYQGAYVDVTKSTTPSGDGQPFSFTATGPSGSRVIALTGATLSGATAVGGTYTPASFDTATNSTTATISDGQTARFFINALPTDQTLTITEAATANWESSAAVSCAPVLGSPALSTNSATRSMSATLNTTNSAAACTISNVKRPRMTLGKTVAGRLDPSDQFTVSASGGGTLSGSTSATTSGTGTTASTVFYSTPATPLTISDGKASGPTELASYQAHLTCTNAFTGPGATPSASLPSGLSGTSASLTPAPGDDISCSFTNTPRAVLVKAFSSSAIGTGQPATLTFTVSNPAGAPAKTGITFTDSFPANLVIAATPIVVNGCGGSPTITASPGAGSFGVGGSGVAIGAGPSSCTVSVNVTSATPGVGYVNGAAQITSVSESLLNGVTDQSISVYAPPAAGKGFDPAAISAGGTSTLTLTLNNPAANGAALSGLRVDDPFPAGLTLKSTSFSFTPAACGSVTKTTGAASAVGDGSVRFFVSTLAPGASCQAALQVTSSTIGSVTNTTAAPTASGPTALTGAAASAGLTVAPLPMISILKSADRASASPGDVVLYTVQLVNSGTGAGTELLLTDDLGPHVAFFLSAGAPFSFADSSPPSGVTLGVPQYSNDNGASWGYTPASGWGAPAGYDGTVTNWRIPLNGSMRGGGSCTINYRVMVK